MFFEISSSSEDEQVVKKKVKIPSDLSLDELIKQKTEEKSEFLPVDDSLPNLLFPKPTIIDDSFDIKEQKVPLLTEMPVEAVKYLETDFQSSLTNFNHCLYELLHKIAFQGYQIEKMEIRKILLSIPDGSLDFSLICYFYSKCNIKILQNVYHLLNPKKYFNSRIDTMLFLFSMTILSAIDLYYEIPLLFQEIIEVYCIESLGFLDDLISVCLHINPRASSIIVSYLPITKKGYILSYNLAKTILYHYLGLCEPQDPEQSLIQIIQNISLIRKIVDKKDPYSLEIASSCLTLFERIIVLTLMYLSQHPHILKSAIQSLKFSFMSEDPSNLTLLKEKLHMTRFHLELLDQQIFNPESIVLFSNRPCK